MIGGHCRSSNPLKFNPTGITWRLQKPECTTLLKELQAAGFPPETVAQLLGPRTSCHAQVQLLQILAASPNLSNLYLIRHGLRNGNRHSKVYVCLIQVANKQKDQKALPVTSSRSL